MNISWKSTNEVKHMKPDFVDILTNC